MTRELRFSYLPSWAKNPREFIDVWLGQGESGLEFRCQEVDEDCAHPISQDQAPEFLAALGEDPIGKLFPTLEKLIAEGKQGAIHTAIHKTLKASFVWQSTNWDD